MENDRLICVSCFKDVKCLKNCFICVKNHHYCPECAKVLHLTCECLETLHLNIKKDFDPNKIACIGSSLKVWDCSWSGKFNEMKIHFATDHSSLEIFSHLQVSSVPFSDSQTLSSITMVDACNKDFCFYFYSCPTREMVYFMIFMLTNTPDKFIYEFMVKVPNEDHCKIKFVENCYHYRDDVIKLRDNENCVAITFKTIRKHVFENMINFSFLIKRKTKGSKDMQQQLSVDEKKNVNKGKPNKFTNVTPSKGIMKSNISAGGSSIPVATNLTASNTALNKNQKSDAPTDNNAPPKTATENNPPNYSSINKVSGIRRPYLESPAVATPSINKIDEQIFSHSNSPTNIHHNYMHYHCPQSTVQPYKMNDTILYKQTYPKDCFSKPLLKK